MSCSFFYKKSMRFHKKLTPGMLSYNRNCYTNFTNIDLEKEQNKMLQLLKGKKFLERVFYYIPEKIEKRLIVKKLPKGSILYSKGVEIEFVTAIVSGKVEVVRELQNGMVYSDLEYTKPNIIGDLEALSRNLKAASTVRTSTDCNVIMIPLEDFYEWYDSDCNLARAIGEMNAFKLWEQSNSKGDFLLLDNYHRFLVFLENLYKATEEEEIRVKKSQVQLAKELAVSVRTIARLVKQMKDEAYMDYDHKIIHVTKHHYDRIQTELSNVI